MYPSPNISRSRPTVIRCKAKHELTKKRSSGGFSGGEREVFLSNRVNCYCYFRFETAETVDDSKGHHFRRQIEIFPKKIIRKFGPRNFPVPQTQCQVSAHD